MIHHAHVGDHHGEPGPRLPGLPGEQRTDLTLAAIDKVGQDNLAQTKEAQRGYIALLRTLPPRRRVWSLACCHITWGRQMSRWGLQPLVIKEWDGIRLNGTKLSLQERVTMTELFSRNHLENMAVHANEVRPRGFRTVDPVVTP